MGDTQSKPLSARLWPWAAAIGLALAVFALQKWVSLDAILAKRADLRQWTGAHPVLALVAYAASYAVVAALAVPGAAVLTLFGGFLFGWFAGGLATVIGATAGAVVLFLAARTALGERLRRRAGGTMDKVIAGFQDNPASYLLFLRLAPVFPFFIVNLAAAVLRAPLTTFVWTTFVGIMPAGFAYALAGAGLDQALAREATAFDACIQRGETACAVHFSAGSLLTPPIIAAMVALAIIALLPVAIKWWRKPSTPRGETRRDI